MALMKLVLQSLAVALVVCTAGNSQPPASPKLEFDAAAIKPAAPQTGHFPSPASSRGGPGTSDPAMYRCSNCNLAFLITKAFALERYQFPGQSSLPDTAFDVSARVPEGTTPEQFAVMFQNLLKDRFGLSYHYDQKQMQGYELVIAKNGPKLKESKESAKPPETGAGGPHEDGAARDWHSAGNGAHELTRPGLMVFNGQAKYRGDRQTTGDLAQFIANQLARPVDDHTGLQGRYDISLSWSDDGSHAASHAAGGGSWDHGDRGGPAPAGAGSTSDGASGPTLIGAVQAQLGLKLEPKKATAKIFIIDRVEKSPTAN